MWGLEVEAQWPASKTATLLGAGAILLWATLASLTTLRGAIPPLETTAIVFAIGSGVILLAAAARAAAAKAGLRTRSSGG